MSSDDDDNEHHDARKWPSLAFTNVLLCLPVHTIIALRRTCKEWNERITTWPLIYEALIVRDVTLKKGPASNMVILQLAQDLDDLPRRIAAATGVVVDCGRFKDHLFYGRRQHATAVMASRLPHLTAALWSLHKRLVAAESTGKPEAVLDDFFDSLNKTYLAETRAYSLAKSVGDLGSKAVSTGVANEIHLVREALWRLTTAPIASPDTTGAGAGSNNNNNNNNKKKKPKFEPQPLSELQRTGRIPLAELEQTDFSSWIHTAVDPSLTAPDSIVFRVRQADTLCFTRLRENIRFDNDVPCFFEAVAADDDDDDDAEATQQPTSWRDPRSRESRLYNVPAHLVVDVCTMLAPLFSTDVSRIQAQIFVLEANRSDFNSVTASNRARTSSVRATLEFSTEPTTNALFVIGISFAIWVLNAWETSALCIAWLFSCWGFSGLAWIYRVVFSFEVRIMLAEQRFPWPTWEGEWNLTRVERQPSALYNASLALAEALAGEQVAAPALENAMTPTDPAIVESSYLFSFVSLIWRMVCLLWSGVNFVCAFPVNLLENIALPMLGIDAHRSTVFEGAPMADFPWGFCIACFFVTMIFQSLLYSHVYRVPLAAGLSPLPKPPMGAATPLRDLVLLTTIIPLFTAFATRNLVAPGCSLEGVVSRYSFGWSWFGSTSSSYSMCYSSWTLILHIGLTVLMQIGSMTHLEGACVAADGLRCGDRISKNLTESAKVRLEAAQIGELAWMPFRDSNSNKFKAAQAHRKKIVWRWQWIIWLRAVSITVCTTWLLLTRYFWEGCSWCLLICTVAERMTEQQEKRLREEKSEVVKMRAK